jgi:serine/threonine protein kinase
MVILDVSHGNEILKIGDFGLARNKEDGEEHKSMSFVGTKTYQAPEVRLSLPLSSPVSPCLCLPGRLSPSLLPLCLPLSGCGRSTSW